jgi:hypothetical protein
MDLGEMGWGDVDWIGLAQDRNRWRALVNAVMNRKMLGNYRVASQLVAPRVVLSSIESVIINYPYCILSNYLEAFFNINLFIHLFLFPA